MADIRRMLFSASCHAFPDPRRVWARCVPNLRMAPLAAQDAGLSRSRAPKPVILPPDVRWGSLTT